MTAEQGDSFNLDDRDRLPWLEPAGPDDQDEDGGASLVKIILLVLAGLLLLGLIVGGGYWLKNRGGTVDDGEVRLIPADNGSYKIPANASDNTTIDGEGDEAFQASAGGAAGGQVDPSRAPEVPRTDLSRGTPSATPSPAPSPRASVSATVRDTAAPPSGNAAPAAGGGSSAPAGARVQIGAFNSEALAQGVWRRLSARLDFLEGLSHTVEPVKTGGRTLYRLRATTASPDAARDLCGKLRVAGENCILVH